MMYLFFIKELNAMSFLPLLPNRSHLYLSKAALQDGINGLCRNESILLCVKDTHLPTTIRAKQSWLLLPQTNERKKSIDTAACVESLPPPNVPCANRLTIVPKHARSAIGNPTKMSAKTAVAMGARTKMPQIKRTTPR